MLRASKYAFFAVAVLVACAIDDRTLKETEGDDDGGSGGRGGSTGGTATGGSDTGGKATGGKATGGSDTGGKATGGSAGGGGTGKGGTAGKGGTGGFGAAEDCNGDPIEVDEATVRACLMQWGCSPYLPVTGLSNCITYQRLRTFAQDDCGTGAENCDDFLSCSGYGYVPDADCSSGEAHCESTLAVSCGRRAIAVDCSKRGGECGTYIDTDGTTIRASCHHTVLDGCVDPADTSQCGATDIAYSCVNGEAYGTDCGETGAECRDGGCYYVLPTCATPGSTCSTSTRVDQCYSSNNLARFDCAAGLGCEEDDTGAECRSPGCTDTDTCTETCSGTRVNFCYGRVPVTLDCTDYGFTECHERVLEGDFPVAYCAVPVGTPDLICDPDPADTACGACAKTDCCAEWTACADSPDCVDFVNCATDCAGASACIDACESMHPAGTATYNDFIDCRSAACAVECSG